MPAENDMGLSDRRRRQIHSAIADCLERLHRERFEGYDPADLLNTSWRALKRLPAPILRALTVINVRSPINLRPLLRIRPATNTTALTILGRTCLNWRRCAGSPKALEWARELAERLVALAITQGDTMGWSRTISYQASAALAHTPGSTLTFINACAAEFFMDMFDATGEEHHRDLAAKVCAHFVRHTLRIECTLGTCLSYVSQTRQEIPNASILAGAALNRFAALTGDETCLRLSLELLDYTLNRQNCDGSWDYSYDPVNGPKRQYDFHQCYMLDAIRRYAAGLDSRRMSRVDHAFVLGTRFYCDRMFDANMRPLWRYPRRYPIDVHNVSHAVYFFSRHFHEIPSARTRLDRLLSILLDEFYDPIRKYFYYQQYPFIIVKHDFFRWNTAWSLYALSHLLCAAAAAPEQESHYTRLGSGAPGSESLP